MKKITISVKNPCSATWNDLTPERDGRFCHSCKRSVADLTRMSDSELLTYLQLRQSGSCARIRKDQLRSYTQDSAMHRFPGIPYLRAAVASLFLLSVSGQLDAQVKEPVNTSASDAANEAPKNTAATQRRITLSGQVLDETGQPMPGANVLVRSKQTGTTADSNGYFTLPNLEAGDAIVFSFIGYESKEYKVSASDADGMSISMTLDIPVIMGELAVDMPPSTKQSVWSKLKDLF